MLQENLLGATFVAGEFANLQICRRMLQENLLGAAPQLALVLTSIHPLGTAWNRNF